MILLVSHAGDDHLAPVLTELDRIGGEAVVVDTSTIPRSTAMCAEHTSGGDRWRLRTADGAWLDLRGCRSGWWRRALPSPSTRGSPIRDRRRGRSRRPTRR